MSEFKFTIKEKDRFLKILRDRPLKFLRTVQRLWKQDDNTTVGEIIRNQLSGRKGKKGLNRVSGQAARALNIKTEIVGKDVVSTMFIPSSNPAKDYLPTHDKSRKGDGTIRAKNKPYLVFKMHSSTRSYSKSGKKLKRSTKEFRWVRTKQVKIPIRTNIIEYYTKEGGRRRAGSIRKALKELAHG